MHWALAVVSLTLLAFAAISGRIAGTPITAPMIFTGVGLLLGSEALGLVEPAPAGETVKLLAEATLATVLFADASQIDLRALRGEVSVPARLLGVGLPLALPGRVRPGSRCVAQAPVGRGAASSPSFSRRLTTALEPGGRRPAAAAAYGERERERERERGEGGGGGRGGGGGARAAAVRRENDGEDQRLGPQELGQHDESEDEPDQEGERQANPEQARRHRNLAPQGAQV